MYQPPHFRNNEQETALGIMRGNAFASLVSTDDEGLPFITHLPLHTEVRDGKVFLYGHCAKANPHWRYLQQRPRAVATFLGPHAYQSPKIYPDLARVPSWNYIAVHCVVNATLIEDPLAKDRLLKKLIGDHEPPYAEQWRSLGEEYAHKMLAGIMGFELEVTELQCKLKLNQHRPESHGKMHAIYSAGNEDERALAKWMERLGMAPAQPVQQGERS